MRCEISFFHGLSINFWNSLGIVTFGQLAVVNLQMGRPEN